MDADFYFDASPAEALVSEPAHDECVALESEAETPTYLGWPLARSRVVRSWWVPALLGERVFTPRRLPPGTLRRVVSYDEPIEIVRNDFSGPPLSAENEILAQSFLWGYFDLPESCRVVAAQRQAQP
ncbi:MAG: hypothetical protein ABIU95_04530 [Burkholderiales bacterium]